MKKVILALVIIIAVSGIVTAQTVLDRIDDLHERERYEECVTIINDTLKGSATATEKAELYWRLARATLQVGDDLEASGAPVNLLLEKYQEGERYADMAIEADPKNHLGYYFKSANIGRWGQTKGILNSLFKAKPMRDLLSTALTLNTGHGDTYYVLGMLYEQVPGKPLSFGNADYAVSLGRKSIDANLAELANGTIDEEKYVYHLELARHLYARGWDIDKREKERAKKASRYESERDVVEKAFNYEGIVDIPRMSDRQEAVELLKWFIAKLESLPTLDGGDREDLAEAKEDLAKWL